MISWIALFCAGLVFFNARFLDSTIALIVISFIGGFFNSFAMSLNDSVFSDLEKRNKLTEMKIIALSRISMSFSFIAGPLAVGILSDLINYKTVFSIIGLILIIFSCLLLLFSPKKLRLKTH